MLLTIFNDFCSWNTEKSITMPHSIMDLIYSGPLFRSAIPVKDQKGFVRANTKRGLGSINKQNQQEVNTIINMVISFNEMVSNVTKRV